MDRATSDDALARYDDNHNGRITCKEARRHRTPGRPMDAFAGEFLDRQTRYWKAQTLPAFGAAMQRADREPANDPPRLAPAPMAGGEHPPARDRMAPGRARHERRGELPRSQDHRFAVEAPAPSTLCAITREPREPPGNGPRPAGAAHQMRPLERHSPHVVHR